MLHRIFHTDNYDPGVNHSRLATSRISGTICRFKICYITERLLTADPAYTSKLSNEQVPLQLIDARMFNVVVLGACSLELLQHLHNKTFGEISGQNAGHTCILMVTCDLFDNHHTISTLLLFFSVLADILLYLIFPLGTTGIIPKATLAANIKISEIFLTTEIKEPTK